MSGGTGPLWSDLTFLLPELILVGTASFLLVLDLFVPKKPILAAIACAGSLAAAWTCAVLLFPAETVTLFGGMFVVDGYACFFKLVFFINVTLIICVSLRYMPLERAHFGEYYALLLFATTGMMLMASAADLMVVFLGLELMTLSTYVLVGMSRHSLRSNEAALKLFLLGGFSTGFLLYGIALVYGLTGSTDLRALAGLMTGAETSWSIAMVPVLLLLVGFAYKIAAVPFHMWAPDVYEGAPTTVTAFLSVGAKAAGFAALARVITMSLPDDSTRMAPILATLAVLSMATGSIVAISQTNVKRMLAYSSIAHAGYALLGIVAGPAEGLSSMMAYLFVYGLMNIGAFAVVIALRTESCRGEELADLEGLASRHPLLSLLMLIFMFSLAGIPPTAGFIGKLYVFVALTRAGYAPLAVVAVIFSVVSAFVYLKVVVLMYMREPEQDLETTLSPPLRVVLGLTGAAIVAIGVFPSPLLDLVRAAMQ